MTLPPEIESVALLGWHLYPASSRTKAGCFKGAAQAATCDLDTLAGWYREYPRCNWRVVCGPSAIWGIDCDVPPGHAEDGVANFAALAAEHQIPRRPTIRTGGGGIAIFFRHDGEPIRGDAGHPVPGCDPRRGRQSQTIPPSVHIATRRPYRWLVRPWEVTPPPAPAWLLDRLKPPPEPPRPAVPVAETSDRARRALIRAIDRVAQVGEGGRNDALNRNAFTVARYVAAGLLCEKEAVEALYAAARQTGLPHREIRATLQSAFHSAARRPVERDARE